MVTEPAQVDGAAPGATVDEPGSVEAVDVIVEPVEGELDVDIVEVEVEIEADLPDVELVEDVAAARGTR